MPQWSVQGAFATTGRDATILVEAPTADAAVQLARDKGLLVATINPSDPSTLGSVRLAYQTPLGRAPQFRLLRLASLGFTYLAFLLFALAAANLVMGFLTGPPLPTSAAGVVTRLISHLSNVAEAAFYALASLALAGVLDVAHAWALRRLGPTAP